MAKKYWIISRDTWEIISEYHTEKEVAAVLRDTILPDYPGYLADYMVQVVEDNNSVICSLYDFAVRLKVIKGRTKA